jgi:hypothetical protein
MRRTLSQDAADNAAIGSGFQDCQFRGLPLEHLQINRKGGSITQSVSSSALLPHVLSRAFPSFLRA